MMRFSTAVTKQLTPLFNRADLKTLLTSDLILEKGLWRPLETQLPKGIPLQIEQLLDDNVCEIKTPAYYSQIPLYTHLHFIKPLNKPLPQWQKPSLPPLSLFLSRIHWCLKRKTPYLWGGNTPQRSRSLHQLYPHSKVGFLQGVDCSGLIYWSTRGATARNTSELINEGTPVTIQGLSSAEIENKLRPGMLIIWKGHVLVVTEEGIVESTPEKGVSFSLAQDKLNEIQKTREPVDEWPLTLSNPCFTIRNLYCNYSNHTFNFNDSISKKRNGIK